MLMEVGMVAMAASVCAAIWRWHPRFNPILEKPMRPAIGMVIDLIRAGKDWEKGRHVWWHPSGVTVWVANEDYGLGLVFGAKSRHEYATATESYERGFKTTLEERKALWKAIQAPIHADANVLAVAEKIAEMYEDARPEPVLDNVVKINSAIR